MRSLKHHHRTRQFAAAHRLERLIDLRQRQALRDQLIELEAALQVQVNDPRHVYREVVAAHQAALDACFRWGCDPAIPKPDRLLAKDVRQMQAASPNGNAAQAELAPRCRAEGSHQVRQVQVGDDSAEELGRHADG